MSDTDRVPFWKSDFTADQLRDYARSGIAMPDGSYPVPDAEYLTKAIHAVGRGSNNSHDTIRKHVIKRARALGLSAKIPDGWGADGSIEKSEDVDIRSPLWKDDAQQIVWGVVLTPGLEDSQGDVAPAEEIQKAAHSFLADYRAQDIQHSGVNADIVPVESFIAPCDFTVTDPTGKVQTVLKGAWVLASKVNDPEAWESVQKGERTGWSIEGSAVREAITAQ